MASHSSAPPEINIEAEYCPEAVIKWYNLIVSKDRKDTFSRKDLSLKAKQHLRFLGWNFWYIDKKCRWELRYTCPTNGTHYTTLKKACEICIKEDGCALKHSSNATERTSKSICLSSSKKRPRYSEETHESTSETSSDESTSDKDSENSSYSHAKRYKAIKFEEKDKHKHVSSSESDVIDSGDSDGKREDGLKMNIIEKNSEGCGKRERERCTLISWLIKNEVLISETKVFCSGSNNIVKRGRLFCHGIVCDCCHVIFTITGFVAHARCSKHRPSTSIFVEDGRSLLECQREALSLNDQKKNVEATNNDSVCSICGFGGNIVLCDRCPSSFHLGCLGLDRVPDGDWFCPTCCCKICYGPKCKQECRDDRDNNFLVCVQCEQKYHFGCLKAIGFESSQMESDTKKNNWFCSVVCGNMFLYLKKLLGKPIKVADDITWTLVKNVSSVGDDDDDDGGDSASYEFRQNKSKLNEALDVLYESFSPTIDPLSGREVIKDVVFSRDSKHKRSNFCGFYNVILEKRGEVISVATIRIYGQKVAEIVFVATKRKYQKQGMCRLLMNELEEQLSRLGVGSFILHSSDSAINTWTKSFGFVRMIAKDKCRFVDHTFLEFENTIMCFKPLNRSVWPRMALH